MKTLKDLFNMVYQTIMAMEGYMILVFIILFLYLFVV
jgi:hypothetical protein